MKIIAVYPGRFQPFHKGHGMVYKWLKEKFGNATIATTDKVDPPKSPFNFKEKKKMMELAGVSAKDIVQVVNPYIAKEILRNYDPKTTVLVFAVSQKDMDEDPRFSFKPTKSGKPGYLQPYAGNEKKLKPFGDPEKPTGYVVVTPTFQFQVLGEPMKSATELRKQFASADNKTQKNIVGDLFGRYDASVHKLMSQKIKTATTKSVKTLKEEITHKEFGPMLDSFVDFASDHLGLPTKPKINFDSSMTNSFGGYNPSTKEIIVATKNRHPMDIFRTVAHELVHHKQNGEDRIKNVEKEGSTGSDIENEANSEAGKIMRWFAKANPDMFTKKYVKEENINEISGPIGALQPKKKSDNYIDNLPKFSQKTNTPVVNKDINSNMPVLKDAPKQPEIGASVNTVIINKKPQKVLSINPNIGTQLEEGINDPGKLKAIFLAGGPGSGKDFVMNSALAGNGLREINSDVAFEHLMKKRGLDLEMPESEKEERDETRKRAKNVTAAQQARYLDGGLGVIINGTADDVLKIMTIKQQLENMGYETSMVFVNTSDEVSRQRNVERGKMGKRKVPDGTDKEGKPDGSPNIRKEKWDLAQKNIGELQKIFGNDRFAVIDNTEDIRKVSPEKKQEIETNFNRLRRFAMKFTTAQNQNPKAVEWETKEAEKRGITQYTPARASAPVEQPKQQQATMPPSGDRPQATELEQARRLGLSYYGFGRFGRKINGQNTVLYLSKNGQLVKKPQQMQESKVDKDFNSYITNTHNRDEGSDSLRNIYASMTPGQETMIKKKIVKKKLAKEDNNLPRQGLPIGGGIGPEITQYRPFTVTGFTMSESIRAWANNSKTQQKFYEKYGNLAEQKLYEAAMRLEESGCGCDMPKPKSVKEFYDASKSGLYSGRRDEIEEKSEDVVKPSGTVKGYKKLIHPQSTFEKKANKSLEEGTPAWQRKEGKSEAGGLNRKGIASYRRENPGSKLSMAVTTKPSKLKKGSKAANRRKSFCARMGGMKKRLTSAKTARDPDSRINKALRKWNCEE